MSEEKKSEVTEEVKEARKLSMEELEQVNGGAEPNILEIPGAVVEFKPIQ